MTLPVGAKLVFALGEGLACEHEVCLCPDRLLQELSKELETVSSM